MYWYLVFNVYKSPRFIRSDYLRNDCDNVSVYEEIIPVPMVHTMNNPQSRLLYALSNQGNHYHSGNQKNVIQGKYQTWKTDIHNKEHKVIKIIHTK